MIPTSSPRYYDPAPDARVATLAQAVSKETLFLIVVSFGEIRKGLTIMPPGARRNQLARSIEEMIPAWFAGRILPMTRNIAKRWGFLEGHRQSAGRPLPVPDARIAATALEHGLTLVTRNGKDFDLPGVSILNPWD